MRYVAFGRQNCKLLPAFSSLLIPRGNVYKAAQENAACSQPFWFLNSTLWFGRHAPLSSHFSFPKLIIFRNNENETYHCCSYLYGIGLGMAEAAACLAAASNDAQGENEG